jgi:type III secretion protein F
MNTQVGNIGGFLNDAMSKIGEKGETFQKRIDEMTSREGGISQEDLLQLQFDMGQYNALIESMANITKSLTDTLKSLAQKSG